ncbi:hypothetical protein QBC38DRAFT_485926 [Podospora fimiseda]|uniref:Uncharacterized protein n=1 Tax=Podospora fimiseda TaxID=252190 RepID=A0AAN7BIR3_9PEZI|nr:hypothetical protein QBC38DRAFT_485926 [Podospora fimiseda]
MVYFPLAWPSQHVGYTAPITRDSATLEFYALQFFLPSKVEVMTDHNNTERRQSSVPAEAPVTTNTESSIDPKPWIVISRAVMLTIDIVAVAWVISFVNKIKDPFSERPTVDDRLVGKGLQYTLAVISISLAIFIDFMGATILTLWAKLKDGRNAVFVMADLFSGVMGIIASAIALGNKRFIFEVDPNSNQNIYPTMGDRKGFVGFVLTVGLLHLLSGLGLMIGRCIIAWRSGAGAVSNPRPRPGVLVNRPVEDDQDLPPPWTAVDTPPKTQQQKSSLRPTVYGTRFALLVFDLMALGYMTWYISLVFEPWSAKIYNSSNEIASHRYIMGFVAIAIAIVLDLIVAGVSSFNSKYPNIDGLFCLHILDLFSGIMGIAAWGLHKNKIDVGFEYHEGSRSDRTSRGHICVIRVPSGNDRWCVQSEPFGFPETSVIQRYMSYRNSYELFVCALGIAHLVAFVGSLVITYVVSKRRKSMKEPPKYSTFDLEASGQPPSYEMGVMASTAASQDQSGARPAVMDGQDGNPRAV